MQNVKAIFYDAGMTLIYPEQVHERAFLNVCNGMGFSLDIASITRALDATWGFYHQSLREDNQLFSSMAAIERFWIDYNAAALNYIGVSGDANLVRECAEAIYKEYVKLESWLPYEEVIVALSTLRKAGYIQGVVSDWDTGLRDILDKAALSQYFDFVLASAEVGVAKPNRHIFDLALSRARVAPEQAIHIGDSYFTDVLGARAANVTPILLDRSNQHRDIDCIVVNNLKELADLLESDRRL